MQVKILGCGSARPTRHHLPSAQVLTVAGHHYLIDAGEGAQHSLILEGYKITQLEALFISHAHGDHCFGLPGLLTSMAHVGRTKPLTIVTTAEVADYIRYIEEHHIEERSYELSVVVATSDEVSRAVYSDPWLQVDTLPLRHRTSAIGFLCREHCMPRRIDPVATDFYQIPHTAMHALQMGLDYVPSGGGRIIPNRELTKPGRPSRSYAYLSDTLPAWHLVEQIRGVDLLYHESTYSDEFRDRAAAYGHSTARQAAEVAAAAEVGRLLLGHYSGRYDDLSRLLGEAQEVFPNSFATQEGDLYEV
ncbi:ribonuclease Z [uncultured Porphyromonas sp.]|uniref:ribonuclease Z n=1 Tax=uncultured Porphyromonas sp. TaxID=159274 RepID=UPI00262EEFB9|nr:ribonuclease Z [uncultured Porphyromonas sp.]